MDIYFKGKVSKEKRYQYVLKHLDKYGNTVVQHDAEYISERLKNDGIDHSIRKVTARSEGGRKIVKEVFWVIELAKCFIN